MIVKLNTLLALGMIALICQGCATGRIADLRDCGKLSVGAGFGLGADVGVGALTHPSVGIVSMTKRVGLEDRFIYGQWTHAETYFPALLVGVAIASSPSDYAFSYGGEMSDLNGAEGKVCTKEGRWLNFIGKTYPERSFFNKATDLEAGATLGVISARVGFNPLEFIDFLLGFVGLDVAGDDKQKPQGRVKSTHGP